MKPLVSIIIPTYNRSTYLKQALEGAIMQDYPNLEIIISDNASTLDTRAGIEPHLTDDRLRFYRNETNIGMVNNWRKSLQEYAKGEWFILLSDDDYFIDSSYVSKAIALTLQDENVNLVFANGSVYNEESKVNTPLNLPFKNIEDGMHVFFQRNCYEPQHFTLVNVLFNRAKTIALDGFSNPDNLACDSELFLKLCVIGKVGIVQDYVSVYRIHANNLLKSSRLSAGFFVETSLGYLLEAYNFARTQKPELRSELEDWSARLIHPAAKGVVKELMFFHPATLNKWLVSLKHRDTFGILALDKKLFYYRFLKLFFSFAPALLVNSVSFLRKFKNEISLDVS